MVEENVPTEETIQEKVEAAEETIDGRTALGKRLKAIEDTQREILKTLLEHGNKIAECSVRR